MYIDVHNLLTFLFFRCVLFSLFSGGMTVAAVVGSTAEEAPVAAVVV